MIRLKSAITAGLSAEQCTGYNIVVAYRFSGVDAECEIEIAVNDINEGPTFGASSYVRDVEEDKPADTAVGQALSASDPDRGQELTFSIVSGNTGSSFRIGGCTGQIFTTKPLDYDTGTRSFSLRVRVTDNGNPTRYAEVTVTVRVTNRNEPPVFPTTGDYSFQVAETTAVGGAVSPTTAGAVDPDGDTLTYSILNEDKGALAINSRTGAITVVKP